MGGWVLGPLGCSLTDGLYWSGKAFVLYCTVYKVYTNLFCNKQLDCNKLKPTSERLQPTHQLDCNQVDLGPNPVDPGPKWKTTKMEDDQNGRRPKWKTTKMEDDQNGRRPKWMKTKMEDDPNGRRP